MNTFLNNFPILAIMILFVGAFVTSLVGRRSALARNGVVLVSMTAALAMMLALVKPVLLDGQVITYWLGNWEPASR